MVQLTNVRFHVCFSALVVALDSTHAVDIVSLAPLPNCTKLGRALCYQAAQAEIKEVMHLDPLACKPPDATLRPGNCSAVGFSVFSGTDPIFRKVGLWEREPPAPPPPAGGNATAAELRRWEGSTSCTGSYTVLSTDVMNQCTPYHVPALASILVLQKNRTAYSSYHYQGEVDCSGAQRTFLEDLAVGTCSGDLGGYSQMRVWVLNSTFHCSAGCECCPCTGFGCKGTCPDCGGCDCSAS
eukprot:SAG11_NODE_4928_length_1719_cov_1.579012_2_plen_240_part_00